MFIVGHIFESMLSSTIPNCSEINDVVGLINDGVDGLIVVKETMYSKHSNNCVEMLSKVVLGAEQNQVGRGFAFYSNSKDACLPMDWDLRANNDNEKEFIKIALAGSVYSASKMMKSSLVICITQTGDTVSYLSPYDFDCPILAICNEMTIARKCNYNRGVISIEVGSLIGTESVIEKGIGFAKTQNLIKKGDYVIILTGTTENVPGATNGMRLQRV